MWGHAAAAAACQLDSILVGDQSVSQRQTSTTVVEHLRHTASVPVRCAEVLMSQQFFTGTLPAWS